MTAAAKKRKRPAKAAKAAKPLTVADELAMIRDMNGGFIQPEAVVEYARDPDTALHSRFDWDETSAAAKFRLIQARNIITMHVTIVPGTNRSFQTYVSLRSDRRTKAGYRTVVEVLGDADLRGELLEQAKIEMAHFRRKYAQLVELAKVFEAMDEVVK